MSSKKIQKLVTVIIPVFNGDKYIASTIESVLSQTYENLEIIVIDDGSTDKTCDIVKRYEGKVTYIHQMNRGAAAARNNGLKHAKGRYIQFLDADDYLEEDKIEKQVSFLQENEKFDICYCDCIRFYGELKEEEKYRRHVTGEVDDLIYEIINFDQIFPFPIHSLLVKKSVFEQMGVFDESIKSDEDREFWLRAALKQYQFGYTNFFGAYYRKHGASATDNKAKLIPGQLEFLGIARDMLHKEGVYNEKYDRLLGDMYYLLYLRSKSIALSESDRKLMFENIKKYFSIKSKYLGKKQKLYILIFSMEKYLNKLLEKMAD